MENNEIYYVDRDDPRFPSRLYGIPHSPKGIYVKGRLPDPDRLCVAVVGARNCSDYGRYVTRKLAEAMGRLGIIVISGMARGIDGIAQRGALDAGGDSFAVLGCGADICYPKENLDIYNIMSTRCGIISEYPPGTAPRSSLFPQRNRIISGLSDVVVVVEAREKSGSLITADMALEQGREVYAVPGRVTDSLSHGSNRIIMQGGGIILSPEEFIQDLTVNYSLNVCAPAMGRQISLYDVMPVSEDGKKILSVLSPFDGRSLTAVQNETGLDTGTLTRNLLDLNVKGLICQNGDYYTLKPTS